MTYAFETLNVARVDFRTGARNQRLRQAIERAGAWFEDVLTGLVRGPGQGTYRRGHRRAASLPCAHIVNRSKGTLTCMNPPEEITPEHAKRLVALLGMMGDLDRGRLAFLVGHMASKNIDLAIEAFGALMATEVPLEG